MNALRINRRRYGKTQGEIAKSLGLTSPQYLSNCERGLSKLAPSVFKGIAKAMTVNKKEQKRIVEELVQMRLKQEEKEIRERV